MAGPLPSAGAAVNPQSGYTARLHCPKGRAVLAPQGSTRKCALRDFLPAPSFPTEPYAEVISTPLKTASI
jgi:hypothetical protein